MRRLVLTCFVVFSATACWPFQPSPPDSVSGVWLARTAGHTGPTYEMNLRQSGDEIEGAACGFDAGASLMFRTPVRGEHPHLRWVVAPDSMVPPYAYYEGAPRNVFIGEIDDTGDIIGTGAAWRELRFRRADPARNVRCR